MTTPLKLTCKVRFGRSGAGGQKELQLRPDKATPSARTPRVSRFMALAIKLDRQIRDGSLKDQAEVARLGKVTRSRITQIMNLTLLAPDIQEQLLFLPAVTAGRDPVILRELQSLALESNWRKQRKLWEELASGAARF
ncbi:MAG TPA: hypothetical protein VKE40_20630 [Gemmataceae bacterium]|nr:hypothetical protein [Gemmataceae bacterium]